MSGNDDSGLPILRRDTDDELFRLVGYIGAGELEHALSAFDTFSYWESF